MIKEQCLDLPKDLQNSISFLTFILRDFLPYPINDYDKNAYEKKKTTILAYSGFSFCAIYKTHPLVLMYKSPIQ